ncbi:universal stress protein [Rhodopirellula sp. JC639]|uniref:universal stress protein n=1 Tax=Stieleria mannarensis TaxID=2755585 RepID=UPI0016030FFE|nr:universal stress protein [Rhodopirellula sp. JC639]
MNQDSNLQRLLVGVCGSANGHVAVDYSIQLANRYGCQLMGVEIVDDDDTELAIYGVADETFEADRRQEIRHARAAVRQHMDAFRQRCRDAELTVWCCDKSGDSVDQIVSESQRADLVILGRETPFDSKVAAGSTLGNVLRRCSRPLMTVPLSLPQGDDVLVAYDGSRPAGQSLFAFVTLGLAAGRTVHVVTAAATAASAREIAQPACDFLELHGINGQRHSIASESDVHHALLNLAAELDVGLLVAGACGHSRIHEVIMGSFTEKLIEASHLPVFLFH